MLIITTPKTELWDEKEHKFIAIEEQNLILEHSLISVCKWESKWKKSFLETKELTDDEIIDYVKDMTISKNVNPNTYLALTSGNVKQIKEYIDDPMTATKFPKTNSGGSIKEFVTAEIIYYWMFSYGVPKECEKWHFNKLITLLRVFNAKNQPKKKMTEQEIIARNAEINERNKALFYGNKK